MNRAGRPGAQRVAFVSFVIAAAVAGTKLAVALDIHSVALLGDGLHSAIDAVATAVTLGAVRWAAMPPDREHPYGHGRAENLAALSEAVLMLLVAAGVLIEAIHRLRGGASGLDVRPVALVVVASVIVVDAARAAGLHRAARRYASPALAASALNFTADIAESSVVFVGLALARVHVRSADSVAAIVVAAAMFAMAARIGRSMFHVLMDRHPPALAQRLVDAAEGVPGVVDVGDVRVRRSGSDVHAEMTVTVGRTTTVEQSHGVTEAVEAAVARAVPGTSATVHVEPSSAGEDIIARTFAAANRIGMTDQVHNVAVITHPEGMWLLLHAKVDPALSLARGHEITDALERELRSEIPGLARVEVHLEPRDSGAVPGTVVSAHEEALIADVRRIAEAHPPITRCHEVAVSRTKDGLHLVLHCEAPRAEAIAAIHDASLAVENDIHRRHGDVRSVTIHFEPEAG
jgi:cation diffusion facilitator family transporter